MKKTLIALAAVAATSAAFAQSTVTLSGTIDVGLQKTASGAQMNVIDSRSGTTNWTISGTEDLGGGLKAVFKASTSFNANDGTITAGTYGNNDVYVGLEGGFGSLRLGRSVNPVFGHALTANGTKGVTGYAAVGSTLNNMGVYVANQVLYTSPTFSGFTATLSYAPSEAAGVKSHGALGLRYAAGPLNVTFAAGNATAGTSGSAFAKSHTQLGAAYDFGVARALFTVQHDGNKTSDSDTAWVAGVTAPVGPGLLWAQYGSSEAPGKDLRIFSLGYKYFLSKRTTVYVNLGNKGTAAAGFQAANATSTTGYGFGIQHNF